jgi:adenylate kinase family enzyme
MRRVVIFGTTGSGKSWIADRLSAEVGLRVIELDALYWGKDWQAAPLELLRHRVECEIREGGWIVVGNYGQVRDLTWAAADTLIWLDLPFRVVFWRLLSRTLRRIVTREDLWGTGNRESVVISFFSRDSILLWAIRTHARNRRRFARECETYGPGRQVVRLRSPRDIERFLAAPQDTVQLAAAQA